MQHHIKKTRYGFFDALLGHGWTYVLRCTCGWGTSHEDDTAKQMAQKRRHCNENGC